MAARRAGIQMVIELALEPKDAIRKAQRNSARREARPAATQPIAAV